MGEGLLFQSGGIHQFKTPPAISYVPTWEAGQVQIENWHPFLFMPAMPGAGVGGGFREATHCTTLPSTSSPLWEDLPPYLTTERTSGEHQFL